MDPIDDWLGVTDPHVRRRVQNRLNARASRRRKAEQAQIAGTEADTDTERSSTRGDQVTERHYELVRQFLNQFRDRDQNARSSGYLMLSENSHVVSGMALKDAKPSEFPLSSDHLIPLLQYNVLRAINTISFIMGLPPPVSDECYELLSPLPMFQFPSHLPESLVPTEQQLWTPHEPWIDILPDPVMRDNAIAAKGTFTYDDLETDFNGGMCLGLDTTHFTGMLVWTDPWSPEGWEMTEGFVKRWGFLVKGCTRLHESTNRWRATRGEEPLIMEVEDHSR